ncbi:PPE family protein [Mycobacterium tuberculosis]|nr:PPE family protein [Mycobacterium tuberculosis]SGM50167.1 PPE family protein [Mycobacterium tuberculosis]
MLLTGTRIFTKSPLFVAPFSYSLFYEYRDVHRCLSHWPGRPVGEGAGLMNYSVLPPEINSLRMFTGAGSAPMLAASVAWDGLAAELAVAASSFGSVTSGLAGQSWQGAAAAAMAAAAAPYAGWLAAAAARAAGASAQAKAVASAFEAARAATVHPMLVAANRNAFVQLVLSNLFGQNAPAIAAAEAMYEQMWAADAPP